MSAGSPLEVLHPAGEVRRVLLLGERAWGPLVPPGAEPVTDRADLALIVPSVRDLRRRAWLRRAVGEAAAALQEDAVVYVIVPPGARRRAAEELRRAGLDAQTPFAQLPARGAVRYLVPLEGAAWRYAFASLIAARPAARRLLAAARRLPLSDRWLAAGLPAIGLLAGRAGAPPPLSWVGRLGGEAGVAAHAVVALSWRGTDGATLLHCFAPGASEPWGVVKVAAGPAREAQQLRVLGAGARDAGARVPRALAEGRLGGRAVVAETVVAGRPAADLLRRRPGRADEIVAAVCGWLERWNRATVRIDGAGPRLLEAELLDSADVLAPLLPDGPRYRARLAERCAALTDADVPLVDRHNDLTMWNVVVDDRGSIGVLDWGEAEPAGLPLTDFFYAVADAVAASRGPRSRPEAVRDCFPQAGQARGPAAQHRERLVAATGVSAAAAELCFHACWLRHARNEVAAGGGTGEFLAIARRLSRLDEARGD